MLFLAVPLLLQTSEPGYGIQRTIKLLETSTPKARNTVRILFYGQSITEQKWSAEVTRRLKGKYPNANLIIENRAIGGHSSQLLWRTAEADLYPFQPDLLVFYVYGSHIDYETIIKNVRERTTAEILIQNEHLTNKEDLAVPTSTPTTKNWSAWMSEVFLPDVAKRYGAELLDQRKAWREYLTKNNLEPKDLLIDGVHLNDKGCELMAAIVESAFRFRPNAVFKNPVTTKEIVWKNRRAKVDFIGTRADIVGLEPGSVKVLIDGKSPSVFATTRASAYPNSNWPILKRASLGVNPQAETWTARLSEISADGKNFKFSVTGSLTGADGEGSSEKPFKSNSGRILIEPEDWNLAYCQAVFKRAIPSSLETNWKVIPQFVEVVQANPLETITLVQGLPNTQHSIELERIDGSQAGPVKLSIYRPWKPE